MTVLALTAPDALLVLPKTIFFVKEKLPVGMADPVFAVVKVKVFPVISSTSKVPLNSSNISSAPFSTIRSPERIS